MSMISSRVGRSFDWQIFTMLCLSGTIGILAILGAVYVVKLVL